MKCLSKIAYILISVDLTMFQDVNAQGIFLAKKVTKKTKMYQLQFCKEQSRQWCSVASFLFSVIYLPIYIFPSITCTSCTTCRLLEPVSTGTELPYKGQVTLHRLIKTEVDLCFNWSRSVGLSPTAEARSAEAACTIILLGKEVTYIWGLTEILLLHEMTHDL